MKPGKSLSTFTTISPILLITVRQQATLEEQKLKTLQAPLLLVFLLCCVFGCHDQRHEPAEDEAAIRALAQQGVQAENDEDLETWLSMVADDAVILTAEGPVEGKDAIREFMTASFGGFDWEGGWTLEAVEVSGDLAVMWGPLDIVTTSRESGHRSRQVGYHLDVARRQPDGSWKFMWWTTVTKPATDSSVE
jgi:uncharacterized protein (TIGR02246 family)